MSEEPEATITAYPDGPYLVRGCYKILDVDGNELESTRRTVALCRCGRSALKPLCDGSHGAANFRDSGNFRELGNFRDSGRNQRPEPPSRA